MAVSNTFNSDLITAHNFQIDPTNNNVKKAKISKAGALGLLTPFDVIIR